MDFNADRGPEAAEPVYEAPALARLTALRSRLDPANVFRHNHNIRPAA